MSARYERLASDETRLPEGMERVGYDADAQTYTYRDTDGSLWETSEGQEYGTLHRAGTSAPPLSPGQQLEQQDQTRTAWRYFFPFFLLVGLFLLAVFRITRSPSAPAGGGGGGPTVVCEAKSEPYRIVRGDTCWDVAQKFGTLVDKIRAENPGLDCGALRVGEDICVPSEGDSVAGRGEVG